MKIVDVILDARTERAVRWTAALAAGYALFFYATNPKLDWTLPVQLISGGNLAFYNLGWSVYFGIGSAVAMMIAYVFMCAIFDFLQDDELGPAYAILMVLLISCSLPLAHKIGILDNLNSLFILLVTIFVEVMYGPAQNFAPSLGSRRDMWEAIFEPAVLAAFVYVLIMMGVFLVPPYHSGTRQAFQLVSGTLKAIADAIDGVKSPSTALDKSRFILQVSNTAGLSTPVSLFGNIGLYEFTSCLAQDAPSRLGKNLDDLAFRTSAMLWALSRRPDADVEALKTVLSSAANVLRDTAVAIERERPSWDRDGSKEWCNSANTVSTKDAKARLEASLETLQQALDNLAALPSEKSLLQKWTADSVQEMATAVSEAQSSWTRNYPIVRQMYRWCYLEQVQLLLKDVKKGFTLLAADKTAVLSRRTVRRAIQYFVGVLSLYAIATWWDTYRTLLGSSSTGQWTMVSFFVCFRATTEETVSAALQRSLGHGLGALLALGINEGITSDGGRMGCHLAINFVLTWLIPTPFVYPSSIQFSLDGFLSDTLEGLLTSFHLANVLVFQTSIESAAKARALSQCIGGAVAAVIAVAIFPWFGRSRALQTLQAFRADLKRRISTLAGSKSEKTSKIGTRSVLAELLEARRDYGNVSDSKGWIVSLLGRVAAPLQDKGKETQVKHQLDLAAIACYTLVAIEDHLSNLKSSHDSVVQDVQSQLASGDIDGAVGVVEREISAATDHGTINSVVDELVLLSLNLSLLKDCCASLASGGDG